MDIHALQQQQQQQQQQMSSPTRSPTRNHQKSPSSISTLSAAPSSLTSATAAAANRNNFNNNNNQNDFFFNQIKPMDVFDIGSNPNERKTREQLTEMVNGILVSSGSKALREPTYCTRAEFQQQLSKLSTDQKWIAYLRPHYVVLSRLGRGGYGSVFRARQTRHADLAILTANNVPLDSPRASAKKKNFVAVKVIDRQAILSSQSRVKHLAVELAVLQLPPHANVNHRMGVFHTRDHIIVILELCEAPRPTVFTRLAHCISYRKPSKIGEIDRIYAEWKQLFRSNVDWMSKLEYANQDLDANEENEEIFGDFVDEEKLFLKMAVDLQFPVFGESGGSDKKDGKNNNNSSKKKDNSNSKKSTNDQNSTASEEQQQQQQSVIKKPTMPIEVPSSASLFHIIHGYKRVSDSMSRVIVKQILLGLKNLHHRNKVVHRDLKTENIVVAITRSIKSIQRDPVSNKIVAIQFDENVSVKIVDFGLAKYFLSSSPGGGVSGTVSPSAISSSVSQVFTDQDSSHPNANINNNNNNNSIATSASVSTLMMSPSYSSMSQPANSSLSQQVSMSSFLTSSPQQHLPNPSNMINIIPATPQGPHLPPTVQVGVNYSNNNSNNNNNNNKIFSPSSAASTVANTTITMPSSAPMTRVSTSNLTTASNANVFGGVNANFTSSSMNNVFNSISMGVPTAVSLAKESSSMSEPPPMKVASTQDYFSANSQKTNPSSDGGGDGGANNNNNNNNNNSSNPNNFSNHHTHQNVNANFPLVNSSNTAGSATIGATAATTSSNKTGSSNHYSNGVMIVEDGSGAYKPVGRDETTAFHAGTHNNNINNTSAMNLASINNNNNNNNNNLSNNNYLTVARSRSHGNFHSNSSYDSNIGGGGVDLAAGGSSSAFLEQQQSSHDIFKKVDMDDIEIPVSSFGRNPLMMMHLQNTTATTTTTTNDNTSFGGESATTMTTTVTNMSMVNTNSSIVGIGGNATTFLTGFTQNGRGGESVNSPSSSSINNPNNSIFNNSINSNNNNNNQQNNSNNNNNNNLFYYLGPTGFNDASSSPSFPVVSTPIGTDLYLALEALRGIINFAQLRSRWITTNKQLYKLDVYGVGAMLFFMANGKPPFQPPTTYRKVSKEVRMQQLEELVSKGPQFLQCVSSYTKHFALKMMENDVDKRLSVRRALEDSYVKDIGDSLLTDVGVSGVKKITIYDSKEIIEEIELSSKKEHHQDPNQQQQQQRRHENDDDDDENEDDEQLDLRDSSNDEDELNELRRKREDFGDCIGKEPISPTTVTNTTSTTTTNEK